jgi:hypothetical protein
MAVVYRHRDNLNNVFYVGIGKDKNRAFDYLNRSDFWKRYSNKYGVNPEIIADEIDYDTAKELEILLISEYGRKDLGQGMLVNMTNGGDGSEEAAERFRLESYKKRKAIIQLDLNGIFLNEFDGIRLASRELGICYRQIHRVLTGERKKTRNFVFNYKD